MNSSLQKRILINKAYGQFRVAKIEDDKLYDLEIESSTRKQKIGSIWNAEVTSIAPSLEAAFVNFGGGKNGFLPLREITREYFSKNKDSKNSTIKDVLFEGQKILVQISKEERGSKGAALTTYITLAGCYLVLMPNNPRGGGISRRIEGEERDSLKKILDQLNIPEGMSVIIRTAGISKTIEELQWDLNILINLWRSIEEASKSHGAPYLIHQESDIAIRAVRDHLREDINEILIDDKETYEEVRAYVEKIRPDYLNKIQYYEKGAPLFSKFKIEKQIESIFNRSVRLPSGGEIVIDRTEALTSIDVNSSRATKGTDIEQTALETNLEAAVEIIRQLRIRDLGGLFVIDFIDMEEEANRKKLEDKMYEVTRNDRARIQFTHLSRFGLMEMSRQRLRPPLNEAAQIVCPRCHGQGTIRNIVAQAFSIIHLIEQHAVEEDVKQIRIQVPSDTAAFLLNEQRHIIEHLEQQNHVSILIIPNPYLENPEYEIECVSTGDTSTTLSYELTTRPKIEYEVPQEKISEMDTKKPAVRVLLPTKAAPSARKHLLKKLISKFSNIFKKTKVSTPKTSEKYRGRNTYSKKRFSRFPQTRVKKSRYHRQHHYKTGQSSRRERPILSQKINPEFLKKPIAEKSGILENKTQKKEFKQESKSEEISRKSAKVTETKKTEPATNLDNLLQIETKQKQENIQTPAEKSPISSFGRPRKQETSSQQTQYEELQMIETKTDV